MRLVGAGCLEDVVGKTPADFFPAEVARELEREDAVVLESGQSVVNRHGSREVAGHGVRWFSSTKVPMRDAVDVAAQRVREGAPIGRSLAHSRLFPPMMIHLISSGESSGELESMLERAAQSQERELDGIMTAMVGLLGPLMIVAMGRVVMGIVFAMLLPIFEMNSLIS
jgi:general secretion pathway protein F